MNSAENVSERVKHIKRGTTYTTEAAAFQVSVPDEMPAGVTNHLKGRVVLDGETIITYRDEASGKLYARFPDEFTADRFQALSPPPTEDADRVEPVAWRWKPNDSKHWIYDPSPAWLEDHSNDPNIKIEPLYTAPTPGVVLRTVRPMPSSGDK